MKKLLKSFSMPHFTLARIEVSLEKFDFQIHVSSTRSLRAFSPELRSGLS